MSTSPSPAESAAATEPLDFPLVRAFSEGESAFMRMFQQYQTALVMERGTPNAPRVTDARALEIVAARLLADFRHQYVAFTEDVTRADRAGAMTTHMAELFERMCDAMDQGSAAAMLVRWTGSRTLITDVALADEGDRWCGEPPAAPYS